MLITGLISRELRREDLPPATFGSLDQKELLLAKTADRSVLGCMTDMARLCRSTPRWSSATGPAGRSYRAAVAALGDFLSSLYSPR